VFSGQKEYEVNLRTNTSSVQERLLRLPDVMALVALRKSSIYELIKQGRFPAPVKLSARAVCWPSSAIDKWITERIKGDA
jgi:prophage regulatory protein